MIELEAIYKKFGEREVLRGVTFSVARGEVVCLIGPSGSGKSTILRCVNGLETHDRGTIRVDGIIVSQPTLREVRKRVAMVFQRFNLLPHRTVLENVIEGPIYVQHIQPEIAKKHARELLAKVGLNHRIDAYPAHLSGGEQQRVGIARALAMHPQAILFDEPTSALDPELVGEVLSVMRALANEGMTMIIVTHEIAFAREMADRVVFMDGGVIVESGHAKEMLSKPQVERTRNFLNRVNRPL